MTQGAANATKEGIASERGMGTTLVFLRNVADNVSQGPMHYQSNCLVAIENISIADQSASITPLHVLSIRRGVVGVEAVAKSRTEARTIISSRVKDVAKPTAGTKGRVKLNQFLVVTRQTYQFRKNI